jgi:hypothetical protein
MGSGKVWKQIIHKDCSKSDPLIYKYLMRNDKTEVGFCYLITVEKYEEIKFKLNAEKVF